jgi:hypothetical protein
MLFSKYGTVGWIQLVQSRIKWGAFEKGIKDLRFA